MRGVTTRFACYFGANSFDACVLALDEYDHWTHSNSVLLTCDWLLLVTWCACISRKHISWRWVVVAYRLHLRTYCTVNFSCKYWRDTGVALDVARREQAHVRSRDSMTVFKMAATQLPPFSLSLSLTPNLLELRIVSVQRACGREVVRSTRRTVNCEQ